MPRKMPRVHWVTRSWTKLTMMRGENCMEASVRVMSMMAKTMETTVMMEAAIPQDDLDDLRIGMRGKEQRRNEIGEAGDQLFDERQGCASATDGERDDQRTDQESAAQIIRDLPDY